MTVIVRTLSPDLPGDAAGFAAVRRAAVPAMLATPESVAFDRAHAHPDSGYRQLIAEVDGEIIGTAQVGLAYDSPEPGQGYANVYVHPDRRGAGAGTLLLRTAEEYLAGEGTTTVYSWVMDDPANLAFADRHGYRASRSAHFLRLDLAHGTLPPRQGPPAGVELVSGSVFADDARPLFDLDAETVADEPGDIAAEFTDYAHWLAETWHHPLVSRELTTVALVEGRPAAFSLARTDGAGRYASGMTGTARAHRGKGLAKLAKNDSLHRAREAGCTEAFTGNDAGNEPMLAINEWFGYEICGTEVRHVRDLG
ncbi:GNAT family N-acetyltransferase [Streptomyces formicae]|uniref:Phosphinothricin acetyltransferase, putative n=1 Tax=Streptomyces formicae TaxID=1616117 RepID=A0A291Q4V9_9ACTN|nr:GNAT family N-acetyltransferase [Streptomyces formicae]ATL26622.1 phosphinothricin acetyltransferase, putative [Streptomyces formicae]